MARPARLQSARTWLKTYEGKNLVRGYRKHFGVDWECAFKELEMLGVKVDAAHKTQTLKSVEGYIAGRRRRKAERKVTSEEPPFEQDDYFAYIAGYTEGGFAYGVTWEEWERLEQLEMMKSEGVSSTIEDHELQDWPHGDDEDLESIDGDDSFDLPF